MRAGTTSAEREALGRVLSEQQYDPDGVTMVRSRYGIACQLIGG